MGKHSVQKVLIVDDDSDILQLLKYNLEKDGFRVKTIEHSLQAVHAATEFVPDLIILDILMPGSDGISVCRTLRGIERFRDTVIFFLSAISDQVIQGRAFDAGGNEYIEKVMGLRALTCKIKGVLKGGFVIHKGIHEISVGPMVINRPDLTVTVNGKVIRLNQPEFELLFFLAQNHGKLFSIDNLVQNIWGAEMFLLSSSVDVYLNSLQQKLGKSCFTCSPDNRFTLSA